MVDHEFLPAPLWLVTVLHVVTLTLHLLAMNLLFGGTLLVLWVGFRGGWQHDFVKKLLSALPSIMAATVTLGVAPLLFVQLTYHRQVYGASILSGWYWLMIIAAAIVAYYALYTAAFSAGKRGPLLLSGALLLATLGFVYISFVYSSVFASAEIPGQHGSFFLADPGGATLDALSINVFLRWAHTITGVLTVAGMAGLIFGRKHDDVRMAAMWMFAIGVLGGAGTGLVYLFTLGESLLPFMRTPGAWTLTLGMLLVFGAVPLAMIKRRALAATLVVLSLLMMVLTRHYVRVAKLQETWEPGAMPVRPQWSVFALFLLCFVLAIGLIVYLVRLVQVDEGKAEA